MTPQEAAQQLLNGALVVFPTETVYGLGALSTDDEAVKNIYSAKGRPQQNPLILHIADRSQLDELFLSVPGAAQKLIDHFWPGPLTLCLEKSEAVSDLVTAGLPTVCVRMPKDPIAQEFLKAVGAPVAAPSANLSGKPSTTRFQDALTQLQQDGVFFLEGNDTPLGLESTVIDCTRSPIRLLRPGSISQQEIEKVLAQPLIFEDQEGLITSPGQLLNHYAPKGKLTVILGNPLDRREWMKEHQTVSTMLGLVGTSKGFENSNHLILAEEEGDLESYSREMYAFLNYCDAQGAEEIFLEAPKNPQHPLYQAIMNRLQKASSENIIRL